MIRPDIVTHHDGCSRLNEIEKPFCIGAAVERNIRDNIGKFVISGVIVSGRRKEGDNNMEVGIFPPERGDDRLCLFKFSHRRRMEPDTAFRGKFLNVPFEPLKEMFPSLNATPDFRINQTGYCRSEPENSDKNAVIKKVPKCLHTFE